MGLNCKRGEAALLPSALLSVLLLAGCGGGGDGGGSDVPASSSSSLSSSSSASASSDSSSFSSSSSTASGLVALDASTSCNLSGFRDELLTAINQARTTGRTCGSTSKPAVGALAWEDRLFSAAARHSGDMAANNYFDHTSLDGRTPGQRISAEGYPGNSYGENIGAGYGTVAVMMQGWMDSPGHCNNIMNANFTEVGVSCVRATGAQYGTYWTMTLGRR